MSFGKVAHKANRTNTECFATRRPWSLPRLGLVEQARTLALSGEQLAREQCDEIFRMQNAGVLGFLALSEGDAAQAVSWLTPLPVTLERQLARTYRLPDLGPPRKRGWPAAKASSTPSRKGFGGAGNVQCYRALVSSRSM